MEFPVVLFFGCGANLLPIFLGIQGIDKITFINNSFFLTNPTKMLIFTA
jgi:hypothetical protein